MARTTLRLPAKLKSRIARLARAGGQTPGSLMLQLLEQEVARQERIRDFVQAALASDATVEAGGAVYPAADVHSWMERLAKGERASLRRRP